MRKLQVVALTCTYVLLALPGRILLIWSYLPQHSIFVPSRKFPTGYWSYPLWCMGWSWIRACHVCLDSCLGRCLKTGYLFWTNFDAENLAFLDDVHWFSRETMGFPYLLHVYPRVPCDCNMGMAGSGRVAKRAIVSGKVRGTPLRFGSFWGLVLDVFLWEWFIIHPPKKISVFQLRSTHSTWMC